MELGALTIEVRVVDSLAELRSAQGALELGKRGVPQLGIQLLVGRQASCERRHNRVIVDGDQGVVANGGGLLSRPEGIECVLHLQNERIGAHKLRHPRFDVAPEVGHGDRLQLRLPVHNLERGSLAEQEKLEKRCSSRGEDRSARRVLGEDDVAVAQERIHTDVAVDTELSVLALRHTTEGSKCKLGGGGLADGDD